MNRSAPEAERTARRAATRLLVVATEELDGPELIGELRDGVEEGGEVQVMVVAPAVERTAFQHALGDVDHASREARQRLDRTLAALRRAGVPALGEVGDSDPLIAAQDALREFLADQVLIVAHAQDQARWFDSGLFERARRELRPPLRVLAVRREQGDPAPHLAGVEAAGSGLAPAAGAEHELRLSDNLPRLTRGDLTGILVAVVGTIAVAVLAATGPSSESGAGAAQILIAMGVALVNMAHVVGLVLFESVGERGAAQRFFRNLSLVATPLAVVVNAAISVLS